MSEIFTVLATFVLHTGSRHINLEITDAQKDLLSNPIVKKIVLFCMFYISTRSFIWSSILILVYVLVTNMLLNEKHPFNLYSKKWLQDKGHVKPPVSNSPQGIPPPPPNVDPELYYKNLQALMATQ
jgi:hypothetical protein